MNYRVVVNAEYVVDNPSTSLPLHWPVNASLHLSQAWIDDRECCKQACTSDEVSFAPKADFALLLLDRNKVWGMPFHTVVTGAGYGGISRFLQQLVELNLTYMYTVVYDFRARLPWEVKQATEPAPSSSQLRGRGQTKKQRPAPRHTTEAVTDGQLDET